MIGKLLMPLSDLPFVNPLRLNYILLLCRGLILFLVSFGPGGWFDQSYDVNELYYLYALMMFFYGIFGSQMILAQPILVKAYGKKFLIASFAVMNMFKGAGVCLGAFVLSPAPGKYTMTFQIAGGLIMASSLLSFAMELVLKWEKKKSKKDTEDIEKNTPSAVVMGGSGNAGASPEMRTESETANLLSKKSTSGYSKLPDYDDFIDQTVRVRTHLRARTCKALVCVRVCTCDSLRSGPATHTRCSADNTINWVLNS